MSKTCALCDTKIKASYRLCHSCHKLYDQYSNTPWFKEIAKMQVRQDRIDILESGDIENKGLTTIYGESDRPNFTMRKDIGRPKTDWILVKEVLAIYDKNREDVKSNGGKILSLRSISKLTDNKVGYFTVRSILIQYRPDYNKK
jgi:hypothetical protein